MIASRTPEPLPGDPNGKRLCEIFGRYLWNPITAPLPDDATAKPQWQTITKHPLRPRVLWQLWQDANTLVGVRFTHETLYALLDIDAGSVYCNAESVAQIRAALETIGITRTLLLRSSWSGGLHLYIPLPETISTFNLAVTLKECLKSQGFILKEGQLETFPNAKAYGVTAFIEYQAHRLPLQPSSGSCLLDDDLNPIGNSLSRFWWMWEGAAANQDIDSLGPALEVGRNNHRKHPKRRSHPVEDWRSDLETEITEGWTGYGQTNHLLKTIACYGIVFEQLQGQALEEYTLRIATGRPGYEEYCRHQADIERRVKAWARAAENYYWPMGSQPKRTTDLHHNNIVPFNQRLSRDAQERIEQAVKTLMQQNALPTGVTARAEAITSQFSISKKTLYKYLSLWHPEHQLKEESKRPEPASVSAVAATLEPEPPDPEKAREIEEVYTKPEIMKGRGPFSSEVGSDPQTSTPDRGVRGEKLSFPQLMTPSSPLTLSTNVLSDIQQQVQRLGWTAAQVTNFIAERFGGRRRSQLQDDELIALLYHLRTAALDNHL
ncbi:hypothetical protein [Pseudanabaena sp. FACHB-2040]|uniref:hypothetical protein n=1 Tax=Pseudanabaena sp. FACHB-2040 TaxID=2692859 RepID=UPI0016867349|nr:hypothetical protein [Pseudanabaena sp. FACHB-2040]MBD2261049.1 hypothetical protein [Pseudanabaena sp. FACHB-2040]